MTRVSISHAKYQFAETDLAGIVHFSWYFRYMEEAEHALWRAAGLSIAPAEATYGWPRVAAAFDYKSPLRFEDEFDVGVRIAKVSRRTIQYGFTLRRDTTVLGHGLLDRRVRDPGAGWRVDSDRGTRRHPRPLARCDVRRVMDCDDQSVLRPRAARTGCESCPRYAREADATFGITSPCPPRLRNSGWP